MDPVVRSVMDKYTKLIDTIIEEREHLQELKTAADGGQKNEIKAFDKEVDRLWAEYFGRPQKPAFKNTTAVVTYLKEHGYKVSKSTVHTAVKNGLLPAQENGRIYEEDARAYAATLKKTKGDPDKIAARTEEKLLGEIEHKKVQTEKERLLLNKELGRVIDKDAFFQELAARCAAIDVGLGHYLQTMTTDLILMCGGDDKKAPDIIEKMLEQKKILMNEFVATDKFHVTFIETGEEEGAEHSA